MTKQSVLFIVNHAPYVRVFSQKAGEALVADGHKVIYALDSHSSDYLEPSVLPGKAYYFTDFLVSDFAMYPILPPSAYEGMTWGIIFSDIDRHIWFDAKLQGPSDLYRRAIVRLEKFFVEIIRENKIDVVIYEGVTNSFSIAAEKVCCSGNAKFVGLGASRIPGRIEFMKSGYTEDKQFKDQYLEFVNKGIPHLLGLDIKKYLKSFEEALPTPDYMKYSNLAEMSLTSKIFNFDRWVRLARQVKYAIYGRKDINYAYQTANPLRWTYAFAKRAIFRKFKQILLARRYDSVELDECYYLYPLHFHPESSTSVMAKYYVDEITVIKNIAFSLPLNSILYVKEHPSGRYLNPLAFYSCIRKMPNVRLLGSNVDTKQLIKHSQGVFTLTSTVGFEACILGKPVFVFGEVAYQWFSSCYKIVNYCDVKNAVEWGKKFVPPSSCKIEAFVATFFENSTPGLFDYKELSLSNDKFNEFYSQLQIYFEHLIQDSKNSEHPL